MGWRKKQKSERIERPRNRYYVGAKLSEHKFLRLLRGYADGLPMKQLEPTTHVSGKTIRATYRTLRVNLPLAAERERTRFAGVGSFLFEEGLIAPRGRAMLAIIEKSRRFGRYIKRQAPRLASAEEHLYLLEKAVRIFCALDLRGAEMDEAVLTQIAEAFVALRPGDQLQKLADFLPAIKAHAHPTLRLYEDYRRYLLKNPVRNALVITGAGRETAPVGTAGS